MENARSQPVLSVQLYTLRTLQDTEVILDAVSKAGYKYVELVGPHLDEPSLIADHLAQFNLAASSAHVSLPALQSGIDKIVAACQQLGVKELFMPAVAAEYREAPAPYWSSLGHELAGFSDQFERHGIRLGYHNHDWELHVKDGDKTALDLLFEAAGQSGLTWQADIAWLARGGADPQQLVTRYSNRVVSAHVKDLAPAGENEDEGGWADVGHGVLDWPSLWKMCVANGARLMVVEHDRPSDPVRSVLNSFQYIKGMTL